jgi:hypothetical protein
MDLNNAKYRKYVERLNKDPNNSIYAYKVKKYSSQSSQQGGRNETQEIVSKIDKMLSNTQRGGNQEVEQIKNTFTLLQTQIEKLALEKKTVLQRDEQYNQEKAVYEEQKKYLELLINEYAKGVRRLKELLGVQGQEQVEEQEQGQPQGQEQVEQAD